MIRYLVAALAVILHTTLFRLQEWASSVILIGLGAYTIVLPEAFEQSRMMSITSIISARPLGVCYIIVGLVRIVGLLYMSVLPGLCVWFRAIGASLGAGNWLQYACALYIYSNINDIYTSPNVIVYVILACTEFISVYRARVDVKYYSR